jgi:TatD DNase family protein
MVPANIYASLSSAKSGLPLSHSAMIPWTAQFVADCANASVQGDDRWDADRVMREARDNARDMYGV